MANHPKPPNWTPEEEAELRQLWADGVRGEALAVALGRSENAVTARALLLGINQRRGSYGTGASLLKHKPVEKPQ